MLVLNNLLTVVGIEELCRQLRGSSAGASAESSCCFQVYMIVLLCRLVAFLLNALSVL